MQDNIKTNFQVKARELILFDLNGAKLALYASQGAIKDLTPMLQASELWDAKLTA